MNKTEPQKACFLLLRDFFSIGDQTGVKYKVNAKSRHEILNFQFPIYYVAAPS